MTARLCLDHREKYSHGPTLALQADSHPTGERYVRLTGNQGLSWVEMDLSRSECLKLSAYFLEQYLGPAAES